MLVATEDRCLLEHGRIAYFVVRILNVKTLGNIAFWTWIHRFIRADPYLVIPQDQPLVMNLFCARAYSLAVYIDVEFLHSFLIFLALIASLLRGDGLGNTCHGRNRGQYEQSDDHLEARLQGLCVLYGRLVVARRFSGDAIAIS